MLWSLEYLEVSHLCTPLDQDPRMKDEWMIVLWYGYILYQKSNKVIYDGSRDLF